MSAELTIPAAAEPVSLDEARAWLRVDGTDEDDLISALITSARLVLENATATLFVTQGWRLAWNGWPACQPGVPLQISLPLRPLQAVSAIRILDATGVATTLGAATYALSGTRDAATLSFSTMPPAPGRAMAGIEIDLLAGYGAPAAVPQPLRQAIRLLVARWFENRGDVASDGAPENLPADVARLIAPFRRVRLA